jgi:O-antigen ligase
MWYRRATHPSGSLVWGVLAAGIAVALLRGGFFADGQYAFAAVSVVGLVPLLGRCLRLSWRAAADPVLVGLVLLAVATLVAAAASRRSDTAAPAFAACAFPVVYLLARFPSRSPAVTAAVVAVSSLTAVAGIAAVLTHTEPDAERIAGVWRAGGTFEYPPALALACVCGLACVLALMVAGSVERRTGLLVAGLLCAAIALTYDRAGAAMAVGVLALFGRLAGRRRLLVVLLLGVTVALVGVLVAARPSLHRLERHLRHDPIASRADTWSDAWRAVRRRPAEGYGPGGYPRIYTGSADRTRTARAHDTVLEQAVEAGVLAGAAAALVLLAGFARAIPRLASRDPATLGWACVATAVLASGLYDFTWSFPPLAAVSVIALGRLAAGLDPTPSPSARRPGWAGARRPTPAAPYQPTASPSLRRSEPAR